MPDCHRTVSLADSDAQTVLQAMRACACPICIDGLEDGLTASHRQLQRAQSRLGDHGHGP